MTDKKQAKKSAWECECGAIIYGKLPPEECSKCWETDSFAELSEEDMESLEEEHLMGQIRAKDVNELGDEEDNFEEESWD